MEKRQGKCESCGLVMPYEKGKGAWKYFCTSDGKSRRGGDSCGGYCEAGELKRLADAAAQMVKE